MGAVIFSHPQPPLLLLEKPAAAANFATAIGGFDRPRKTHPRRQLKRFLLRRHERDKQYIELARRGRARS
jgi:hypothetical protein